MTGVGDAVKAIVATQDAGLIVTALFIVTSVAALLAGVVLLQYRQRSKSQGKIVEELAALLRTTRERESVFEGKIDNVDTRVKILQEQYNREKEVEERRLQAGADRMASLGEEIKTLQSATHNSFEQLRLNGVRELTTTTPLTKFEKYCDDHKEEHERLGKRLEDLGEKMGELRSEVRSMGASLEGRLSGMAGLLAKGLKIEMPDEEGQGG